jgi:hypothetical protein
VLFVFLALVAAGTAAGARPAPADVRDCRTRAEGRAPAKPPAAGSRLGPLRFLPSLQARPSRGDDPRWRFVAKAPVVLPARTRAVLAVAPAATARAALQSRAGGFVSAIQFSACRETVRAFAYDGVVGPYTGFGFAIGLTTRSACVPLELWVDGRAAPYRRVVPVGRRSC